MSDKMWLSHQASISDSVGEAFAGIFDPPVVIAAVRALAACVALRWLPG